MNATTQNDSSLGDPRRCSAHPWVHTSSLDGMFDAPCGHCEHDLAVLEAEELWGALSQEDRDALEAEEARAEEERKEAAKAYAIECGGIAF